MTGERLLCCLLLWEEIGQHLPDGSRVNRLWCGGRCLLVCFGLSEGTSLASHMLVRYWQQPHRLKGRALNSKVAERQLSLQSADGGLRGATIEMSAVTTNLKRFTLKMVTCACFIFHHLRVLLSTVCEPPPSAVFPREQLSATDLNEVNRCQVVGLLFRWVSRRQRFCLLPWFWQWWKSGLTLNVISTGMFSSCTVRYYWD